MERFIYQTIPVSAVLNTNRFCCRRDLQDKRLEDSIRSLGVLIPPIFYRQSEGFEIIAGHKRLDAVRRIGLKHIGALVIESSISREELFLAALISNMNQTYSEVEQLNMIRMAQRMGMTRSSLVTAVLPALGLEPSANVLDIWERRTKLAPAVIEAIEHGDLPCRNSECLDVLDTVAQEEWIAAVRGKATFTASQLKKSAEWFGDLIRARKDAMRNLLGGEGFVEILNSSIADKRAAADQFMSELFKIRYPNLRKAKDSFQEAALSVQSEHIQIIPPEDFEDEGFTVKMRVKNQAALDAALELLDQKKSLLRPLFDFMI